jgi:hypothetical protein
MVKLRGTAASVSHDIVRTPHEHGYFEAHVHEFFVGPQFVRLKMYDDHQAVRKGDHVVVAGWRFAGQLNALAFKNYSTGESGNVGKLMHAVTGLACLAIALAEVRTSEMMAALVGLAGVYLSIRAIQIAAATRALALETWAGE